jgi:hypothetical protein
MRLLVAEIQGIIGCCAATEVECVTGNVSLTSPDDEKRAYSILGSALQTREQLDAFSAVIKYACIGVMSSFFTSIDAGIVIDNADQYYDIVDRETRESITTYSAQEEFWNLLDYEFIPFHYNE